MAVGQISESVCAENSLIGRVYRRGSPGMGFGALPFTIHINDIDVRLNDTDWKFPNDKEMVNIILSEKNKITSKEYPSEIVDWLYRWQMPFIVAQGKLLQIRVGNGREAHEIQSQGCRRYLCREAFRFS